MAIEYAAAYQMSEQETAAVLADAFLKGLLAAHHDIHAESAAAWDASAFVSCTEVPATSCVNFFTRKGRNAAFEAWDCSPLDANCRAAALEESRMACTSASLL
jgi:hypothetical protein